MYVTFIIIYNIGITTVVHVCADHIYNVTREMTRVLDGHIVTLNIQKSFIPALDAASFIDKQNEKSC